MPCRHFIVVIVGRQKNITFAHIKNLFCSGFVEDLTMHATSVKDAQIRDSAAAKGWRAYQLHCD